MILTPDALRRIFQTLYGYRWAMEAAKHMGVSLKTIRRWTKPGGRVPLRRRQQIGALVDAHVLALEEICDNS